MKYLIVLITLLFTLTVNAQTASKSLTIGPKTNDNKQLKFNRNSSTPPQVRWNEASGKLQFTNDGILFKDLGSGGGGGEGGINILENPGFEDGITVEWTCTSGDCTETTSGADLLIGTKSLKIDANAVADTVSSTATTMPAGLYGAACEAKIMYKGGDGLYELSVVDGDGTTLNTLNDSLEIIPSSSIATNHSVFFTCPTETAVTGDPDKGNLSLKITSTSAAATALSVDQTYLGTLQNLTETTLPDYLSARVTTGTVSSENVDFINGNCAESPTGTYTCNFNSGFFSVAPSCVAVYLDGPNNRYAKISSVTSALVAVKVHDTTDTGAAGSFHLVCSKQGVDAKQTVQVYKSIPKISNNINEFSAKLSSTGAVSDENVDWIDGNCTNATPQVCTFISTVFSTIPNCSITAKDSTTTVSCQVNPTSTTSASLRCTASDDTNFTLSVAKTLSCQKSGTDFKTPIVQPMVLGQVLSGASGANAKVGAVTFDCVASPTISVNSQNMVASITRNGTGDCTVNFNTGYFSTTPVCSNTYAGGPNSRATVVVSATSSSVRIADFTSTAGAPADGVHNVICVGLQ